METLQVGQLLFNIVIGIAGFLGGFTLKSINDEMKAQRAVAASLQHDLNDIRVLVAGQYVTKVELRDMLAQLKDQVEVIGLRFESRCDKFEEKLDKIK